MSLLTRTGQFVLATIVTMIVLMAAYAIIKSVGG